MKAYREKYMYIYRVIMLPVMYMYMYANSKQGCITGNFNIHVYIHVCLQCYTIVWKFFIVKIFSWSEDSTKLKQVKFSKICTCFH